MDMRRLIDETDFDNLNELSRRWKKDSTTPPSHAASFSEDRPTVDRMPEKPHREAAISKEGLPHKESAMLKESSLHREGAAQKENLAGESNVWGVAERSGQRKRGSAPQVMDEDTEHFRNRLEHLLNGFKTDAVGEFMAMKRSMLEYQAEAIKGDTQRYLTMYEEKHQELLTAKEQLIAATTDLERKTMQLDLMSAHVARLNHRLKAANALARPFARLRQNAVDEKNLRMKMADAARRDERRLKMKAVGGWRNVFREAARERDAEANQRRVELEVAEIVARFQKEAEGLRERLAEATRKNDEYENSKTLIQENLKKAFLRGISSMNMEAMGIFGAIDPDTDQPAVPEPNNLAFSRNAPSLLNQTALNPALNSSALNIPSNSSFVVGKAKVESKDHKWREAPILGMEEKQEVEEPRMQLIRPSTEAKVIRVVDGRSNVEATREGRNEQGKRMTGSVVGASKVESASRVQGGSRKKI